MTAMPTLPNEAWEGADTVIDPSACPICLRDSCEDADHLRQARAGQPDPIEAPAAPDDTADNPPPRLRFVSAAAVMAEPRPVDVIEGLAAADRLSVLAGESGAGKTFVLTDAVAHVSSGIPWHGRAVTPGSVAYVSFEGDALGLRLRAVHDVSGHPLEHVHILRASDPLSPRIDRDRIEIPSRGEIDLAAALADLVADLAASDRPPIVLLVIDTVRASLSGSEDSSESVSAYLRVVRRIAAGCPGAATVLVHHTGWQDGEGKRKRERGSSAFRGNVDITAFLEGGTFDADRGEADVTLTTLKVRDAERPPPLRLIRRRVELNEDNGHGQPVTSCVIDSDRRSREERDAEQVQEAEASHRETDEQVLKAMRDYPAATSQARLRAYLGIRNETVSEAVARILQTGWAVEGKRGDGYTLTDTGRSRLNGEAK